MLESAYLELKYHDSAVQLSIAISMRITASRNPWSDYHKSALIHEMDCEEVHQNAMLEFNSHK